LNTKTLQTIPQTADARALMGACFDSNGGSIAVLLENGQFSLISLDGFRQIKTMSLALPTIQSDAFTSMLFDSDGQRLQVALKSIDSYHSNSQGCTNCAAATLDAAMDRLFVFNLDSQEMNWFQNVVEFSKDWILANENGLLVGYNRENSPVFGPIPYTVNFDQLFFDPAKEILVTSRRDTRPPLKSFRERVNLWDLKKNTPLSRAVSLPFNSTENSTIIGFHLDEGNLRLFCLNSVNNPFYLDQKIESYPTNWVSDSGVLDWVDGYSGFQVPKSGPDNELSGMLQENSLELNTSLLAKQPRSRFAIGVGSDWTASQSPSDLSVNKIRPESGNLSIQGEPVKSGYEFAEGILLESRQSMDWKLIQNKPVAITRQLNLVSSNSKMVVLRDHHRGLEYQIPINGGAASYRAASSEPWREWRLLRRLTEIK
jgi:hypothetical protein